MKDVNLAENKEINNASILYLISKDDTFYYYKGSLTTIPCTENVNWIVFKDIKTMSYEQYIVYYGWKFVIRNIMIMDMEMLGDPKS